LIQIIWIHNIIGDTQLEVNCKNRDRLKHGGDTDKTGLVYLQNSFVHYYVKIGENVIPALLNVCTIR